ncbi:MAG: hypothetical protein ACFCU4_08050 [Puniceicoccaceae bacterium]
MDAYDWLISRQATERFFQFRPEERRKLLGHFEKLVANVHVEPAACFIGSSGEKFAIGTLDKHVITYHVDHAVKLARIIAIE